MTASTASAAALARARTLEPQFDDVEQQRSAAALGMWIFLTTETLFFGALFFAYAIARVQFPDAFVAASRHTNLALGTVNTAVLLTSSFTMALAVRAAALRARRLTVRLLVATGALGIVFAAIKLAEYAIDYRDHLVPVLDFAFDPRHAQGARVFFGLYFATTGLHLVHLAIGIAIVLIFAWRVGRSAANALAGRIEIAGLYWHFVDLIWIFLYPCLYLVSRA